MEPFPPICAKHNDRFWYLPEGGQAMRCMWCDMTQWRHAYHDLLAVAELQKTDHAAFRAATDAIYEQNAALRKLLWRIDAGLVAAREALDKTGLV